VQDLNGPKLNGGTGTIGVEALVESSLSYVRSQSALLMLRLESGGNRPSPRQKVKSCFYSIYKTVLLVCFGQTRSPTMEPKLIVGCVVFPLSDTLFVVLLFEPNNFFFALVVMHGSPSA
jgi:hypothetical protein